MINGVFISIRLRHEFEDVSVLAKLMNLCIKRSWMAGELRRTPHGKILEGKYSYSYCLCKFPYDESNNLEDQLLSGVEFLGKYKEELSVFNKNGGRLSFYMSFEKDIFEGVIIDPSLLRKLSDLGIYMEIDKHL